jgi:hypothetical protein
LSVGKISKEPVWKPEVAWYFFSGGLSGAASGLAAAARLSGNDLSARRALLVAERLESRARG